LTSKYRKGLLDVAEKVKAIHAGVLMKAYEWSDLGL
jgi:hypothetical protein